MIRNASFQTIKKRIVDSNTNASRNRNLYPIQEQATLMEVWQYVPCECNGDCICKKFGCTSHWKLRQNLTFDDVLPGFLRMFVDKRSHTKLRDWVSGDTIPSRVPKRLKGALPVLQEMKNNWSRLCSAALKHNKTLICDDWYTDFWKNQWNFPPQGTSIHKAKQFCVLLPDICIPYDTHSRNRILNCLNNTAFTYFEMLSNLRERIIEILESENGILSQFRKLDCPREQLAFDSNLISLRRKNFNYGTTYTPDDRPISRIVDKYFYQPGSKVADEHIDAPTPVRLGGQKCYPLSGSGQPIYWENYKHGKRVSWRTTHFNLPDELIDDILENYFKDSKTWYPLGSSMTAPINGGLGEYIQKNFSRLTPRHASAIAAIMVRDNLIECRGKKPLELRKLDTE